MIPHADQALTMLAQRVMGELVPHLDSNYAMSDGALTGVLLTVLARELEDGVARRIADGRAMASLLLDGREKGFVDSDVGMDEPASLRLSAVDEWHAKLSRQLIALHERVEAEQDETLNDAIWRFYHEMTERHRLAL